MREIKFRAWDKMENIMSDVIMLGGEENWKDGVMTKDYIGNWDRFEIQQFTGLKDKNGKDIYEGDIVMISDYYTEHITDDWQGPQEEFNHLSQVVFNSGMFGVDIKEKGDIYYPGFHSFGVLDDESEELEVIGNIFENPELIK